MMEDNSKIFFQAVFATVLISFHLVSVKLNSDKQYAENLLVSDLNLVI